MIRAAGRTDFQQGSARRLYQSVHERLFALPDATIVYPGHDYAGRLCSSIGEERRHNPRLGGGRSVEDFGGFMDNLALPHPNQIDIAVPANRACGRPADESACLDSPWEPARRNFAGVLEVDPAWLAPHLGEVRLLDVREPAEWTGELGHIAGARLVPLGELRAAIASLSDDKEGPIVTICRSGGRSAQAALILERAGFSRAANLTGGMIEWRSRGFPVDEA
jgi:rhodanese-related sulfurtransferase